jgi:hypothetical protein
MTLTCALLAFLVAAAAAVRSTWSPCGLSMLSTITPFAERAKGHRYAATCSWFVLGATVGGLALGGVTAGLAAATRAVGPTPVATASLGLAAALCVLVSDTGVARAHVPVHHRQVNERWLDAYRPWVYGAGFGFQIGTGVATYITTAAVYLMVVLGALTGDPVVALAVGGAFGLVRGLAVTLTHRVGTPNGLLAFHQRFAALRPRADRFVLASVAVTAVVLAVAAGPVPSAAVTAAGAVGTVVVRKAVRRRRAGSTAVPPAGPVVHGSAPPPSPSGPDRPSPEPDRSVAVR